MFTNHPFAHRTGGTAAAGPGRSLLSMAAGLIVWFCDLASAHAAPPSPLSPEQALASFDLEPGLVVSIAAAEPLVDSPCAVAWDEQGRMLVAENRGYPTGGPDGAPVGRLSLLEDTDGDGRADRRTDFATGLTFPNGVMPWRGGWIVTCAPDVLWFKDTDGDGRADVKEVLLTGFATNQSTQLRVNAPLAGPDGWVYLASGLSSGKITSPRQPGRPPLELKGDLRFQPDTGVYEPADGKSQFGQSFDDFGRRFGVFNRVQVQHFVLPSQLLARNPDLPVSGVLQNCPELVINRLMRGEGGAARIFPISANVTTADSHAGYFTAACAVHAWRGGALPPAYDGGVFSCDPTGNLVHADRLEPSGATFSARRTRENSEFLRSPDAWFRPVALATGPDGALYVCDLYRKTIEHPEYLPVEIRKRTDFESGKGLGRIWRVHATGPRPANGAAVFQDRGAPARVAALSSANPWVRDTAFRLLLQDLDAKTLPLLLRALPPATPAQAAEGRKATEDPATFAASAGQARALNLLALLTTPSAQPREGGNDDESALAVRRALMTASLAASPGVRETALRHLTEDTGTPPAHAGAMARWSADPNARVRLQCALLFGNWKSPQATEALAGIALQDGADRWTRAAVLSGAKGREAALLNAVIRLNSSTPGSPRSPDPSFTEELGRLLGLARNGTWSAGADWLRADAPGLDWKLSLCTGYASGARQAGAGTGAIPGLAGAALDGLVAGAARFAANPAAPESTRLAGIHFLREFGGTSTRADVLALTDERHPPAIRLAAARALSEPGPLFSGPELLARWSHLSPALRTATLNTLLSRESSQTVVLDAIDSGVLPASSLIPSQRDLLKKSKTGAVQARAEKLFAAAGDGDRLKAYETARGALKLTGVPGNGREMFRRACANCHRLDREGYAVGPDLFDVRNQPKESILLHIVVPEQEVAPNFANYVAETRDGRTISGLLVSDTPGGVTLRQALGVEETVQRSELASLTASPLSLMPQELEKAMTLQELADLLAFLKGE